MTGFRSSVLIGVVLTVAELLSCSCNLVQVRSYRE